MVSGLVSRDAMVVSLSVNVFQSERMLTSLLIVICLDLLRSTHNYALLNSWLNMGHIEDLGGEFWQRQKTFIRAGDLPEIELHVKEHIADIEFFNQTTYMIRGHGL